MLKAIIAGVAFIAPAICVLFIAFQEGMKL